MEKELYYSLKKSAEVNAHRVALSLVCRIHGADEGPLNGVFINVELAAVLSAFDISKTLGRLYPGRTLTNAGPTECVITYAAKKRNKAYEILKAVFLCAVMFFGGAFTIITFHEDVGMRTVQSDIYLFFTGVKAESVPAVSIPYSVGLAAGFILLFGLLGRRKKRPSVLDLDIFAQDKNLKEYISSKKDSDG